MVPGQYGIGRSLLSIPIPVGAAQQELVDPTVLAWDDASIPSHYSASFSPQAGFYLLSYEGPNVPWQRLIKVDDQSASRRLHVFMIFMKQRYPDSSYVFTDNLRLNQTVSQYQTPSLVYSTIDSDGYGGSSQLNSSSFIDVVLFLFIELNALEIRPPNMDISGRTKYPVLFRV